MDFLLMLVEIFLLWTYLSSMLVLAVIVHFYENGFVFDYSIRKSRHCRDTIRDASEVRRLQTWGKVGAVTQRVVGVSVLLCKL